jgi:hypothetical protein
MSLSNPASRYLAVLVVLTRLYQPTSTQGSDRRVKNGSKLGILLVWLRWKGGGGGHLEWSSEHASRTHGYTCSEDVQIHSRHAYGNLCYHCIVMYHLDSPPL